MPTLVGTTNIGNWSPAAQYNSLNNASGFYNITVRVIDSAGHINYSNNVTVYFDNTQAPNVSIFYPPNNGVVTIHSQSMSQQLHRGNQQRQHHYLHSSRRFGRIPERIQYSVSGSQITNWSTSHMTFRPRRRWYNLTARANDSIGKSNKSANVSILVDNLYPNVSTTVPANSTTSTAHSRSSPSQ